MAETGSSKPRTTHSEGVPDAAAVKNLPANAGGVGLTLELGRSPGEGNGCPIPWTEEPGGLQSRVTKESDTTLRLNNSTLRGYRARLVRNTERGRPGAGSLGGTSGVGALPCACQLFSRTNAGRLRTGFQKLTCLGYHGKLTS